jgi:hypothetical protein
VKFFGVNEGSVGKIKDVEEAVDGAAIDNHVDLIEVETVD